jgi:hypothetical protein
MRRKERYCLDRTTKRWKNGLRLEEEMRKKVRSGTEEVKRQMRNGMKRHQKTVIQGQKKD